MRSKATVLTLLGVVSAMAVLGSSGSSSAHGDTTPAKPDKDTTPKPKQPSKTPEKGSMAELAAILARKVAALGTGDPAKMRAEASKLRKEGHPDDADDLEYAATMREEELRAEHNLPSLPPGANQSLPPAQEPNMTPAPPYHAPEQQPAPKPTPKPPVKAKPRPSPMHPAGTEESLPPAPRVLRLTHPNMTGPDVVAWQHQMRLDGFDVLNEDGVFGEATDAATREWQTDHDIASDGAVGMGTLGAIGKTIKLGRRTLKRGSYGPAVKAWKTVLVSAGYKLPVNGTFDVSTEQATQAFQFEHDLNPDGIVGPKTLAEVGKPAHHATAPAAPAASGTYHKAPLGPEYWAPLLSVKATPASKGAREDVRAWQIILIQSGATDLKADGLFGTKTESATIKWQNAHNLRPGDGVVGKNTRAQIPAAALRELADYVAGDEGEGEYVGQDLQHVSFRATSPLPGILPAMVPDEQVSHDRSLAARLALHLSTHEPGTEDRELVAEYQRGEGLNATGNYGAATAISLVAFGFVPPRPFFWPRKDRDRVRARYRLTLLEQSKRDPQRADEWERAAEI